jgi:hypothetical protein
LRPDPVTLSDCRGWLPQGKQAAVCFAVDDVHPATSQDEFDAGGDLGCGALGHVEWLLARHSRLRITLFVTPDWRLKRLVPTRRWLTRLPLIRNHVHWAPLVPKGRFRVDHFPTFVAYLNALPRTDVALHGLTHTHPGPRMAVEFQEQSRRQCAAMLREGREIFAAAGLRHVPGFAPPAWNAPPRLYEALIGAGFHFVGSARDLETRVSADARTAMSGQRGASLIQPMWVRYASASETGGNSPADGGLVHFTSNFQATSKIGRALEIVDAGGLLSIKAHVFKSGGGITMLDGLDLAYCQHLTALWQELDRRYGDSLWWTSFAEVAVRCRATLM